MQTHGNLTASYLWQPGEFARRMLGERPSPVSPTRELWPAPQQPLSISTLHITYLQDEPVPRRAATLPSQTYIPTTMTIENEHNRPSLCTVGTNTDPPETILNRLKRLTRRQNDVPVGPLPPTRLTAVPRETSIDKEDNAAMRALNEFKKAISSAKYRITPGTETVESPKIVYDVSKPGNRMTTTFGARESRRWCSMPSKASCSQRLRAIGGWCRQHPRRPSRRPPHPPRLQITQV
ncbi:uncharacterized protein LOC131847143 isoform X1 [Achroia grisella]|uniref:uncharacterized protein LOC131847143 isoform X1 n=1 Tax=Achroia grisella TaxID=688607 RepID=UPI0027D2E1E9|nr:uncharacterized protein LOC131847143 isoform X1 [Achroia grisella]